MIKDFFVFVNDLQSKIHEVILMIDANELFSTKNSGISKFLSQTHMCDPIFLKHGSENKPTIILRVVQESTSSFVLIPLLNS